MLLNLRDRYASELELAHQFLSGNAQRAGSSPLGDAREDFLLKRGAQCPICIRRLFAGAFNVEHCHPRGMGGKNRLANKIAMCMGCNNLRNVTMQSHIGENARRSYPENRQRAEEFLLWSLVTVDDGLAAGAAIPEVQEIFLEMRGIEADQDGDALIFGRLSTWTPSEVEPTELRELQPQQEVVVVHRPSLASTTSDDTFDLFHITSKGGMRFPKDPIVVARLLLALEQERGSESSLSHSARSIREQVDGVVRSHMDEIIWRIASVTAQPLTKVPTNWSSMPNPVQLCLLLEAHTLSSDKIQSKSDDRYVKAYFGEVLSHLPDPASEAPVSAFSRLRKWANSVLARFKGSPPTRQDSPEDQVAIAETSGDSVAHSSTPVSDGESVTEVRVSAGLTEERMQTDIKIGIRGFSAGSKSYRMPRDPHHLLHLLQLIASFDLDGMTYYKLYARLRDACAQPPPPSSMLRVVIRIRELSELEQDDPVDAVLLGDETVVATALHRRFVEYWIPHSISDESPLNEIDVREVDDYFRTIGSTYMS